MSSWAKATNRDGKVPKKKLSRPLRKHVGKATPSTSRSNKKRFQKNSSKQRLGSRTPKPTGTSKDLVDRSTSPIESSDLLAEKGIKRINVIEKGALLNALKSADKGEDSVDQTRDAVTTTASSQETRLDQRKDAPADQTKQEEEEVKAPSTCDLVGNVAKPVKNPLLEEFKQQIQEKQIRKEKERLANIEYERKIKREAERYDYFFGSPGQRSGGGTPIRHNGQSVANLKLIGGNLVTIKTPSGGRSRPNIKKQCSKEVGVQTRPKGHNAPTPSKPPNRDRDVRIMLDDSDEERAVQQPANDDIDGKPTSNTSTQHDKTYSARELYQLELQKQIELKRQRKEKEKKEMEEWERKKHLEMLEFNPFGRGGNGAPIKDPTTGNIVANLRVLGRDLVTINRDKVGTRRR